MTQTTYYEFNKPEGTDLVNPLVDTNPNWDALDADLHEFNERSISNATEVVSLGVHTISRLDTTAKFIKWIATANFTSGETFTVDGLPVAASTPAGAALATNAYVTGSVVLACLNADNTVMTIYVSGTTVASDSERLGGELPSYYGTASDVSDNTNDITNLQNQVGNTSIVGIGDGTCTGAVSAIADTIPSSASSLNKLVTTNDITGITKLSDAYATAISTTEISMLMGDSLSNYSLITVVFGRTDAGRRNHMFTVPVDALKAVKDETNPFVIMYEYIDNQSIPHLCNVRYIDDTHIGIKSGTGSSTMYLSEIYGSK